MFAVRGQGRGGGKSVDDEDSKWEVTNTYFTSIIQTLIDSRFVQRKNLVKTIMIYYSAAKFVE